MRIQNKITITAFILIAALVIAGVAFAQPSDVKDHWAEKEISEWLDKGLAGGYPDGTFKPDEEVTRAEFVSFTNRAFDISPQDAEVDFSDVEEGDWYYNAIATAKSAGYIGGYPDGTFKPGKAISREEAASIITRLLSLEKTKQGLEQFEDYTKISGWAQSSIGAVVNAGLMSGYPDNTFGPERSITRAEAVVTLDRAMEHEIDKGVIKGKVTYEEETVEDASIKVFKEGSYKVLDETTTDEEGTFQVELEPGEYDITASTGDKVAYKSGITLGEPQEANLSLEDAAVISGTLEDEDGNEVENAKVLFTTNPTFVTETNEDGEFTIALLPEKEYTVRADNPEEDEEEFEVVKETLEVGEAGEHEIDTLEAPFSVEERIIGGGGVGAPSESSATDITGFSLEGVEAEVTIDTDEHTVDVIVPAGTDLANLTPEITISNDASIDPESGESQDFSKDKVYTVTAEDGTTQDWTVSVRLETVLDEENATYDYNETEVDDDIEVTADNVTLKNVTIDGNLIIDEAVDEFTAVNVIVKGETVVNGGSPNTIEFNDSELDDVEINKNQVRVRATGTRINRVSVRNEGVSIEGDENSSVGEVSVESGGETTLNINTENVNVSSEGASLSGTGKIGSISIQAPGTTTIGVEADEINIENENAQINYAPKVATPIEDQSTVVGQEIIIDAADTFTDKDGDDLTLKAESSNKDVASAETGDDKIITIAAHAKGTATITVTAKDGRGGKAKTKFDVTVGKVVENIVLKPEKETIIVGGELPDYKVIAKYSDGSTTEVTESAEIDTSEVDVNTVGDYTVTASYAEEGITKEAQATLSVVEELSKENDITGFDFEEVFEMNISIDKSDHEVAVVIPEFIDATSLTPIIEISEGAKIHPGSGETQNFSKDVTYTVTAEDGSQQKWIIQVISKPLGIPSIIQLEHQSKDYWHDGDLTFSEMDTYDNLFLDVQLPDNAGNGATISDDKVGYWLRLAIVRDGETKYSTRAYINNEGVMKKSIPVGGLVEYLEPGQQYKIYAYLEYFNPDKNQHYRSAPSEPIDFEFGLGDFELETTDQQIVKDINNYTPQYVKVAAGTTVSQLESVLLPKDKQLDLNVIYSDSKEQVDDNIIVDETMVVHVEGENISQSFQIYCDKAMINYFAGVSPDQNNVIEVPLSELDRNTSITVNKHCGLVMDIEGSGPFSVVELYPGENTIEHFFEPKTEFYIKYKDLEVEPLFKALNSCDSGVRSEAYENINFTALFELIKNEESLDKARLVEKLDLSNLISAIKYDENISKNKILEAVNVEEVLSAMTEDDNITKEEILDAIDPDKIAEAISDDENASISEVYDALENGDYEELFNIIEKTKESTKNAIVEAINFSQLFDILSDANDSTKVRVFNAVNFTDLFKILAGAEQETKDIILINTWESMKIIQNSDITGHEILDCINFKDMNIETIYAWLSSIDGEEGLTIKAELQYGEDNKISDPYYIKITK